MGENVASSDSAAEEEEPLAAEESVKRIWRDLPMDRLPDLTVRRTSRSRAAAESTPPGARSFEGRILDQLNLLLGDAEAAFVVLMQLSCILEEWIYTSLPGFKGFFWSVALAELACFACWAFAARARDTGLRSVLFERRAPLSLYAATAVALGLSQATGKIVNRYLNYATGTILKSGKLVPTLIISVLWLRRSVSRAEWAAAVLLVISAALMALGESAVSPNFDPLGIALSAFQLMLAALQGNFQEKALKDYNASISEAMAFSNGIGVLVILVGCLASGEAAPAAAFFMASPLALGLLMLRSFTFFLGALALTALTKEHGTGSATAVGTARKSLTVLISFLLFPKPFHVNYILGTMSFLVADLIYLQMGAQRAEQRKSAAVHESGPECAPLGNVSEEGEKV